MSYQLKYGSYVFPAGWYPADDSLIRSVPVAKLARTDGARVQTGRGNEKSVELRGGIIKGPFNRTDWRTRVDALKAACAPGTVDKLYFETDRYYRDMQVRELREPLVPTGYGRLWTDGSILLVGPDPRAVDTASHSDTWSGPTNGATHALATVGGNAYADAVVTVIVSGVGSQAIDFTITNNTTGEAFTLDGTVTGGDHIIVSAFDRTVTISGVDKISLFDGEFLTLNVGANTLQFDTTSGGASSIVTTWNERYW